MPVYTFTCDACGSFDQARPLAEAGRPATCPDCRGPARRTYTVPGGPSFRSPLEGASSAVRTRADRARSGEPVVTGPPSGRPWRSAPAHRHG